MIRGKKILDLIKGQTLEFIDDKSEKKIGFFIALAQLSINFFMKLFFILFYFDIFFKSYAPFSLKLFVISFIISFLNFNFQTTIISLIAYQSYIVSKQLTNILNDFSHSNLENIYQFVRKTNIFIKRLDKLISIFIFLTITLTISICI